MWGDCKIFCHLRRWFFLWGFLPWKTPPLSVFPRVGQLSAGWVMISGTALPGFHIWIHLPKSTAQFLAKAMSVIAVRGKYKQDPLMAAIFICFLRSKGCWKNNWIKLRIGEAWFSCSSEMKLPSFFFLPLSLKSRSQLGGCSCVKAVGMPLLITLITRTKEDKIKSSTIEAVEESLPRCQWTVKYKNCIPIHFYRRETRNYITYSWRVCP